jgi:hypothetical protein
MQIIGDKIMLRVTILNIIDFREKHLTIKAPALETLRKRLETTEYIITEIEEM